MDSQEVLERLHILADPVNAKKVERYGIPSDNVLGIKVPVLRQLAKEIGRDQQLAEQLWKQDVHESKLIATLLAEPAKFEIELADHWVSDLYSWDICDQLCINTLVKTPYRWDLTERWVVNEAEFVRRAGIVMIVSLRIHDKKASDEQFEPFFPILRSYATDERNFVKKAVNWAIRELGKRSSKHHPEMLALCHDLLELDSKSATWTARDAIRELESDRVKTRLGMQ